MSLLSISILFTVGILLAFGDVMMKLWSGKDAASWSDHLGAYLLAMTAYFIALSIYGYMLRRMDFAAGTYAILLFNMIVVAIAGYVYFGDALSPLKIGGIAAGMLSVTLFALAQN